MASLLEKEWCSPSLQPARIRTLPEMDDTRAKIDPYLQPRAIVSPSADSPIRDRIYVYTDGSVLGSDILERYPAAPGAGWAFTVLAGQYVADQYDHRRIIHTSAGHVV